MQYLFCPVRELSTSTKIYWGETQHLQRTNWEEYSNTGAKCKTQGKNKILCKGMEGYSGKIQQLYQPATKSQSFS